jgi:predicted AAA+ superfamily ATPase
LKFINAYNKDDFKEDITKIYYDKLGKIIQEENDSFAKTIFTNGNEKYFVQTLRNIIYDPYGIDSHREKYLDLQYKEVAKKTFELYLAYLHTRNGVYLAKSQRSFING